MNNEANAFLKNAPDWAVFPFMDLVEEISSLNNIIMATANGLNVARVVPEIIRDMVYRSPLGNIEANLSFSVKESLLQLESISTTAQNEVVTGFPFLFTTGVVNLYTYLEAGIKNFIANFLKENELDKIKEISGVKISLGEFLKLNDDERYEHLIEQYEKSISVGFKYGLTRFEKLLEPTGFSGRTSEKARRGIFELAQVRNNLLHRNGRVDKYFKESCPYLPYEIGDKIIISKETYEKYADSVSNYACILLVRIGEKWGDDMGYFHYLYDQTF